MASLAKYAGVFVVVVALVVAAAAVAPAVLGGGAPPGVQPETASTFDSDAILADDFDERGNVSVDGNASGKVVVVDAAHANSFSRSEIQPFVDALVESGHEVRFHGAGQQAGSGFGPPSTQRPLNASLARADALVVISPGVRYSTSEVNGVRNFTERGGRVVMLAEPESVSVGLGGGGGPIGVSIQRVQSQLTPLASTYGFDVGTDYLFNMEENANNFQYVYATPTGNGSLTDGVDRVALPQATRLTLDEDNATTRLTAIDGTQLQSTRSAETYAVAARNGNVTALADSSFLSPDFHTVADNEVLLGNVVEFLTSGEKEPKPTPEADAGPGRPGPGPGPGGPSPPRPTPTPPSP
jgi:hypothetical protein